MLTRSAERMVVENVRIPAGSTSLRGKLGYPEQGQPRGAVVLAGPHPLLGGSMYNNLVRALGDELAGRGLITLRFDYRDSVEIDPTRLARQMAEFWQESHCGDEALYGCDLQAAITFLAGVAPTDTPAALIGYSFGCSLLPLAAGVDRVSTLVLIAPTIGRHDLEGFRTLAQPKLVIAPRDDFALDETMLPAWFDRLAGPKELVRPTSDGHFFRGCEGNIVDTVAAFLGRQWRTCA